MIELLKQAAAYAVSATDILFDSWFTYPKNLIRILEPNFHIIAIVKVIPKIFYTYDGRKLNLKL